MLYRIGDWFDELFEARIEIPVYSDIENVFSVFVIESEFGNILEAIRCGEIQRSLRNEA